MERKSDREDFKEARISGNRMVNWNMKKKKL